jgi:hypothetical protein
MRETSRLLAACLIVAVAASIPAHAGRRRGALPDQVVTLEFRDAACPSFYAPPGSRDEADDSRT